MEVTPTQYLPFRDFQTLRLQMCRLWTLVILTREQGAEPSTATAAGSGTPATPIYITLCPRSFCPRSDVEYLEVAIWEVVQRLVVGVKVQVGPHSDDTIIALLRHEHASCPPVAALTPFPRAII